MKIFITAAFLFSFAFGDFYIVNGESKVKMSRLTTGKIDFSTFDKIAKVKRGNDELHAYGEEVAFNHRHLNFRLSTIDFKQTNYTITEWSEKAKESSESYYINFDDYTRKDGVMLQLFYKNNWYAVVLGEPLDILHKLFSKENLDTNVALAAVKQARKAFKDDELFIRVEKELEDKRAKEADKSKKYPARRVVNFQQD